MMKTIDDVREYLGRYEELDIKELSALELDLNELLKSISEKLHVISPNPRNPSPNCPHCSSRNTIKHTKGLPPRFRCKKCFRTFSLHRQLLFYRKHKPLQIIDLIVYTHTTNMSIAEIAKKLDISLKTYNVWRDQLISILPQLADKFKNQLKK